MSDMNPAAWISGGLGALGSIGEGLINQQTQRETNAMQINLANTAVQRRQADLAKAGINPLMAGRIGGADTPTLQAPQMHGLAEAGRQLGDIPANAMRLQQQQVDIARTQEETKRLEAEKNKILTEAAVKNKELSWYDTEHTQAFNLNATNMAKTMEETKTINALRDPLVQSTAQDFLKKSAETRTETARAQSAEAAAQNAYRLFGAQADQAKTMADQAARYLIKYFDPEHQSNIDHTDLSNDLLNNQNFAAALDNVIKNKFGAATAMAELFSNWTKAAATAGGALTEKFGPGVELVKGYIPNSYTSRRDYNHK